MNRPKVRVRWADKKEARQIRNTVLRLGLDRRKVYSLACNDVLGTATDWRRGSIPRRRTGRE